MAKISVNKLNLSKESLSEEIDFNGNKITVKVKIGSSDKSEIIDRSIGGSLTSYGVDEVILDSLVHYWIALKQTNIALKENIEIQEALKLVDQFSESGLLLKILSAIDVDEYNFLLECCKSQTAKADVFINSRLMGDNL